MYTLIVQNSFGQRLELTHNPNYSISEIDGIDPPDADINTTRNTGADGAVFNSAYMNVRTITITMAINAPAEANRIELYRYFKSRFPLRLFYKNGTRDVYIDGYVQSMTISFFAKKQTVQIVIQCPKPLFNGSLSNIQTLSNVIPMFEFPFAIESEGIEFSSVIEEIEATIFNYGDVDTGAIIHIKADGSVVNPIIYNIGNLDFMGFDLTLHDGDEVIINTLRGEKSVLLYVDGRETNIIGNLIEGSTWFDLMPGENKYTIDATSGKENMLVTFEITDLYEGV